MLPGLQRLWGIFTVTVVVLALAGAVLADVESTVPAILPTILVLAVALGAVAGVEAVDRGLALAAPSTDEEARGEVRSRLAIQIAVAEAPTLLAFAITFALGPSWIVLLGGAASVTALLRVRPTEARLRRFEEAWRASGHDVSALRPAESAG
jgi:protein-S-isoprenylcysteine O-methyltransferase Ste14